MAFRTRGFVLAQALVISAVLPLVGCDAGGLLEVENKPPVPVAQQGHTSTELTNAGNLAKNDKYKLVYTFGQGSPHQNTSTSPDHKVNGGLQGAVNGP